MHRKNIQITILLVFQIAQGFTQEQVIVGDASWYGERFHGRKTASGEIFDMNKFTAAHKTLPFGTYLKVTNLENGKSVTVKVNDRGPFIGERVLDVSKEAARELGFIEKGLAKVSITIVDEKSFLPDKLEDKEKTTQNPQSPKKSEDMITPQRGVNSTVYLVQVQKHQKTTEQAIYKLQLGVYSDALLASKQHQALESLGIQTAICLFEGEERLYRILTKQTFEDYQSADQAKQSFHEKYKIPTFIVQF